MVRLASLRRRPSMLSVVVPAYDVAAYLPACLDSVLAQAETLGRTALEVVVVDDGSPDDVGAIATSERWTLTAPDPDQRVWTDDYSNIVGAFWRKLKQRWAERETH